MREEGERETETERQERERAQFFFLDPYNSSSLPGVCFDEHVLCLRK
jgi:hypothetical protein